MERFKLSQDTLANANDYVALADKNAFVDTCAEKCFSRVSISTPAEGGDEFPPMYVENSDRKSRYLMTALCSFYLGTDIECEEGDAYLMTTAQYDALAGAHVMNQLERYKSNATLRDKVFDIMQDYKDLEKRLNAAVYGLLSVMNDNVTRQSLLMRNEMMQLPEVMRELQELQNRKPGEDGTEEG